MNIRALSAGIVFSGILGISFAESTTTPPLADVSEGSPTPARSDTSSSVSGQNSTRTETRQPTSDLLAGTIDLEAPDGTPVEKLVTVHCATGQFSATVKILHSRGSSADGRLGPEARLIAKTASQSVWIAVKQQMSPPNEFVGTGASHAHFLRGTPQDTTIGIFGKPLKLSISWDKTGMIITSDGRLERSEIPMDAVPEEIGFSVSEGAARFDNPKFVCTPDT